MPKTIYMSKPVKSFVRRPHLTEKRVLQENISQDEKQINVVTVERASTAAASVQSFFDAVSMIQKAVVEKPSMVTISAVGLRLEGRSGCYHLNWFPATNKTFAVDSTNKKIIYELSEI